MLAYAFVVGVWLLMLAGQSVVLAAAGLRLRARIDPTGLPRGVQRALLVWNQVAFAAALIGYPLARGEAPLAYYAQFFPAGRRPIEFLHGLGLALAYLGLVYLLWLLTDNLHLRPADRPGRRAQRLPGAAATALAAAGAEELLFRAILLAGLLEVLPAWAAVLAGAIVFAWAHYMRKVKRYWTCAGHLALGVLLCTAFACTRALWLPLGLHAGGILIIMGLRPFVRSTGPPWVVGASIFPYSGVVGVLGLMLLTLNVFAAYGR